MVQEEVVNEFLTYLDDDRQEQIDAIQRTSSIINMVGVELSKTHLIPLLEEKISYIFDDEVLYYLSSELINIYKSLDNDLSILLPIYEKLLKCEDTNVRDSSIISLKTIIANLNIEQIQTIIYPFVIGLLDGDWFTGKCSASALFVCCYQSLTDEQRTLLRTKCKELINDDSPLVRRTFANQLEALIDVIEKDNVVTDFIPIFHELADDDQDSVRIISVNVGISIAKRLTASEIEELILEKLLSLGSDVSWRVKYKFAIEINNVQYALGNDLTRKYLVKIFHRLTEDPEAQIREEIARNVAPFCVQLQKTYDTIDNDVDDIDGSTVIDPIITSTFFKIIKELDKDPSEAVVEELSLTLLTMGKLIGKRYSKEFLLPLFSNKVLNDSSRIKESIVLNINELIKIIGYNDVADVIESIITELQRSSVWRTRRNLYVTLNSIIQHVDSRYFNEHYLSIYSDLLTDGVAAVRRTGTLLLPRLLQEYDNKWAHENLIPILHKCLNDKHKYSLMFSYIIDEIVLPFLNVNYLEDYLKLHVEQINEINVLSKMIKKGLDDCNVKEMLDSCESKEYFNDNMLTYTEEIHNEILFDTKNVHTKDEYLTTTLKLLLTTFLNCLNKMTGHVVLNVRLRSLNSLSNIYKFWNVLNDLLIVQNVKNVAENDEENDIENDLNKFMEEYKFRNEIFDTINKMDAENIVESSSPMNNSDEPSPIIEAVTDDDINTILETCEEYSIIDV